MKEREVIEKAIKRVMDKLGLKSDFLIEHPADEDHGDYATNVAMVGFEKAAEPASPRELAEKIKGELEKDEKLVEIIEMSRIEVKGPGFINFWLKKEWLVGEVDRVVDLKDEYGRGDWGEGKQMLIDYSAPNIAKRFSVGHLRSTIIGQALYNLYGFSGWKTVGDNHLGDWGTQFGMIVAVVIEKNLDVTLMTVEELEKEYVEYNERIKKDDGLRDKAREAFKRLERGEEREREIWKQTVEISKKEFDRIYEKLDIKIDYAFGESTYEELMKEVIKEAKEKGLARESEGALIVEFDDLPPAMLLKSNGTTTYFTRDMATIKFRENQVNDPKLKADLYIYEVGAEQGLHFKQVFKMAEKMGWGDESKFYHVAHGLVLGKDGKKLSTRKGTAVKLEDLLDEMVEKAGEINKESAEMVGIGAVKFFDLKHNPVSSYVYDEDQALSLNGDSGPYVQYACVRAKSVLRQMDEKKNTGEVEPKKESKGETGKEEMAILRSLYKFGEIVEMSAREYSPSILADYLLGLSKKFNGFYGSNQIKGSKEEAFRLKLTEAVAVVLANGLKLLGVEIPEKM